MCVGRDLECQVHNGLTYQGTVHKSLSGKICKDWTGAPYKPPDFSTWKTGKNYCRNFEGSPHPYGIWCYTNSAYTEIEECAVRRCLKCDYGK